MENMEILTRPFQSKLFYDTVFVGFLIVTKYGILDYEILNSI